MRRYLAALAAVLALVILPAGGARGQMAYEVQYLTVLQAFDLDGEAADDDQILAVANGVLADSTDYFALIAAQPDSCRIVNITVTDANSSVTAGVLTVAGKGCLGEDRTCTHTFTGTGSGVKTLSCVGGEGAYFASISAISTGVLTGEGGAADTFVVGYTANSAVGWGMYGALMPVGPNAESGVNPFGSYEVGKLITTAGLAGTTIAGVNAADDPFLNVSAGDMLYIRVNGVEYERKVVIWGSADAVTINQNIIIPAAGVTFRYKKRYFTTNPHDIVMIPVEGYSTIDFLWSIDANADTGGVITKLECTIRGPEWPLGKWNLLESPGPPARVAGETTTATGSTQAPYMESIDLTKLKYTHCRFGLRFGTGDDADAADEDINLQVGLTR